MERHDRLTGRTCFQQVRREGRRWVHPLVILGGLPNGLDHTRCGFVVSRKMGRAVERNRIRRRLREAVRLSFRQVLPGWDLVWIARPGIDRATFDEIAVSVRQLLQQAGLWQPREENRRA